MASECKYFRLPGDYEKGSKYEFQHLSKAIPYELVQPELGEWVDHNHFYSASPQLFGSGTETYPRHFDEVYDCRFGPIWKLTYYMLMETLPFIPETIIREILSYHVPPYIKNSYVLLRYGDKCKKVKSPCCSNCLFLLGLEAKFCLALRYSCDDLIARIICEKCMPLDESNDISDEILDAEPKFGPDLQPQNEAALNASLCINSDWCTIDSLKYNECIHIVGKKDAPVLCIDIDFITDRENGIFC